MSEAPIMSVTGLSVSYGPLVAVRDVTTSFARGGMTGIFGHNGSGKSTFLKSLIGAGGRIDGQVTFEGRPVAPGRTHENVMMGIAIVPQSKNVFPSLTVRECLEAAGLRSGKEGFERVYTLLPILAERGAQRAGSMSGGEQQLLAVGMALMTQPKAILLDEPTAGLSPVAADRVLATLSDVNRGFGTTIILVEQNVMSALKMVDRAVVFRSGSIVFDDSARTLRNQADLWATF
ncbi:MAG: ABC transporter ATP-binding protein [Beijerinckiaceae bacterium]|nr:ABC transporter ATP-binding protein [Beijerinckiaceae bacterium]